MYVARFGAALCVLAAGSMAAIAEAPHVSVEEIARAWESRTRAVRSFRVRWDDRFSAAAGAFEGQPRQKTVYDDHFSLVMDVDNMRYEAQTVIRNRDDQIVPYARTEAWNGSQMQALIHPGGAWSHPQGYTMNARYVSDRWDDLSLRALLLTYRPFHPNFCFFDNFTARFHVVPGEHAVQGRACVLLQDRPRGPGQVRNSLYLDPERSFIPLRFSEGEGKWASVLTFHEHRLVDGIWAPFHWTCNCGARTSAESKVAECELNVPIEGSEFQLDFPEGTWVFENGDSSGHIVQERGRRRPVTDTELTSGRSYDDFLATETGAFGANREQADTKRRRLIGARRALQLVSLKSRERLTVLVAQDGDIDVRMEAAGDPDIDVTALAPVVPDGRTAGRTDSA